ncbi:hypothetical protein [Miltoncostaea oceani]|uniref:hypothetical protein n=1 Tax=Miltoncostaea oceani TaxID=2843216 RepID=UPI001C3D8A5D|nr:hypothetical protein [Miltoncostaea oceani]
MDDLETFTRMLSRAGVAFAASTEISPDQDPTKPGHPQVAVGTADGVVIAFAFDDEGALRGVGGG